MKTYKEFFIKEGLARDLEKSFKSGGGKAIKCGDYKVTPVKADLETSDFHVVVQDRSGKSKTKDIKSWSPDFVLYKDDKIHFETKDSSKKIAGISRKGDWFFLKGDLGAGKTTFAKSYIQSLFELNKTDLPINIKSPSFPIVISYPLKNYTIYHYDFFRLNNKEELKEIDIFENSENNISIVEWPNIILDNFQFSNFYLIEFDILDLNKRLISVFHSHKNTL